ncbi:MAG: 50S ribosomal protein L17, partial [Candidatus Omnitrophica bacterium]|nr:50S ribosomal protein L17 [Candidatus Omnitrophota bacterium]
MRHSKKRLQLNRFTSWHKATISSIARSILLQQSIKTTLHKAKAARPKVEKLITLAKQNTIATRRAAAKILRGDHGLVSMLFREIGPRFSTRIGGYTRIIPLGTRRGDNAQQVIFELSEIKKEEKKKRVKKEKLSRH